jgi:hypothetical protein
MRALLSMTKVMLGKVCLVYVRRRFCFVRNLQIQRKNQVKFLSNSQESAQIASYLQWCNAGVGRIGYFQSVWLINLKL